MLESARSRAIDPEFEFVETVFGRRRYFTGVSQLGRTRQASAQREAGNFGIQGTVADLLYLALNNFMFVKDTPYGKQHEMLLCLIVHDAMIVEHRKKDTDAVYRMLKWCMADNCAIPGTGGMKLGIDLETFGEWGNGKTLTQRDSYSPKLVLPNV